MSKWISGDSLDAQGFVREVVRLKIEEMKEAKTAHGAGPTEADRNQASDEPGKAQPAADTRPKAPGGSGEDPSAWVPAATLWRDRFKTWRRAKSFLDEHPDMSRPWGHKRQIHAGRWVASIGPSRTSRRWPVRAMIHRPLPTIRG